jgi:NAD(P)-dependent dehydrogenase (short-subunit alcohol dehydrogenase family)
VLLISGSTGIAAATAALAAREGARVFVTSRTPEHGEALLQSLAARGAEAAFQAADLTQSSDVDAAIEACLRRFGRLDAVFNVAGISGRRFGDGPVHECSDEGWDVTMAVNARSVFLMCRAAVRQMLAQPASEHAARGAILNMTSVLGFAPSPHHFGTHAYAASKGAIIALTKSMAASYAPRGIRVNAIAPGLVRTPMSARAQHDPAIAAFLATKQPLGGDFIDADSVARAALFLLSAEAAHVTGQVLAVDAGWGVSEGQYQATAAPPME